MIDILGELNAVHRETGHRRLPTGQAPTGERTVVLRRRYDAPIEDVWDAITNAGQGATAFELEHAGLGGQQWAEFGPGAVGVGWDLTLLGLRLHLLGGSIDDAGAWEGSPEARQFMTRSSNAWGEALRATGLSAAEVARMVENTTRFYAPDPESTRNQGVGD